MHPMKVVSLALPTDRYPKCSTGESKDLPPVTLESSEIKEDVNPRKPVEEKVLAHVIIKPSIEQHDAHAMLRFTIDEFHFVSYDMTDRDDEKGYFIHTASIEMLPMWTDPQPTMDVWPATDSPQAVKTTGKEGNVALTLAASPSLTVGGAASHQLEVPRAPFTLQREELFPSQPKSMVWWKWQMKAWGDFQPFDPEHPQRFRQGKIPPLSYPVKQGQHGGVASFTAKLSHDRSPMQASWPVDKKLLLGVVGQFEMKVEVRLELEIVRNKTFRMRLRNKLKSVPVSQRQLHGSENVTMSTTFAV
ncbi:unnamed protein product [Ascophyllum nodosum]